MYEKWLRSFHAVAACGGFTQAARELGLSQPTVTQQVRSLESRFAIELFHRRGRGVALTAYGAALYRITHDIFAMTDEAIGYLESVRELQAGQLTVGTVGPAATMGLVDRYAKRFPSIAVSVDVGPAEYIVQGLIDYRFDTVVVATRLPSPLYHSVALQQFNVGAFVHSGHPWAKRKAIHVRELSGRRVVLREASSSTQRVVDAAIERYGIRFSHVVRITGREGVREAVLRDMGIGIVCAVDFVPSEKLHFLDIEGADLEIQFFLSCLARRRSRPFISGIFDLAEAPAERGPEV